MKKVVMSIKIDPEMLEQLKKIKEITGISVSALVRYAIIKYLFIDLNIERVRNIRRSINVLEKMIITNNDGQDNMTTIEVRRKVLS
jgi:Ribbon-helix-helix protein, copG family.